MNTQVAPNGPALRMESQLSNKSNQSLIETIDVGIAGIKRRLQTHEHNQCDVALRSLAQYRKIEKDIQFLKLQLKYVRDFIDNGNLDDAVKFLRNKGYVR